MQEAPHLIQTHEEKIITVKINPEDGTYMAALVQNPTEWHREGSTEAEAIGNLILAIHEFNTSKDKA